MSDAVGTPAPAEKEDVAATANVVVKAADMSDDLLAFAKQLVAEAVEKFTVESQVAAYIKKAMDARDGMLWHCIAGIGFGSYVTHVRSGFAHFKVEAPKLKAFEDLGLQHAREKWCFILLFKTA